jgi:aconitate hydratase
MVYLEKTNPKHGLGPMMWGAGAFKAFSETDFVHEKKVGFVGLESRMLPMDFRIGIDVMTTETACLSSIWN